MNGDITRLGAATFPSPLDRFVPDRARLPLDIVEDPDAPGLPRGGESPPLFELAGPRERLFFEPSRTRAGIVTCGGLCPGLNHVIRSVYFELHHAYGVPEVLGFRNGYAGLDPTRAREPVRLDSDFVNNIHRAGGTVLGTSRGPVDIGAAVENLVRRGVNLLFTVGGDGTQRGGHALFEEARRRGHALAVVGIPKTIDNDVAFVAHTFGFQTAVEESVKVLDCAHVEAKSVENGISLVKLMGRHAGFIAAGATVASQDVNFCLVPEVPFRLEGESGLLATLERRLIRRGHAVIVAAEGAGQDLLAAEATGAGQDASGNAKLADIGPFLRERIEAYLRERRVPFALRYFDPSYTIRSVPADAEDAFLCDQFARHAVHAAMSGRTGLVIGNLHDRFIHVPIGLLTGRKKRLDPDGEVWHAVLASTGQPARFC